MYLKAYVKICVAIILYFLIISCEKNTTGIQTTRPILFTANFHNWVIPEGGEGFIFISDKNGNVIFDTTWTGDAQIQMKAPKELEIVPEKVTVTLMTGGIVGDLQLKTYLDIPVGASGNFNTNRYEYLGSAIFEFSNIPNHSGYIVSTLMSSTVSRSDQLPSTLQKGLFFSPDSCFIKLNVIGKTPHYMWINNIQEGETYQIDFSVLQKTLSSTISLPNSSNATVSGQLYGYPNPNLHSKGSYLLDDFYVSQVKIDSIKLYYPASSFRDYFASFLFRDFDALWIQSTHGNIPNTFTKIEADFDFVSIEPDSFKIDPTGNFDQIVTGWYLDTNGHIVNWHVYSLEERISYSLTDIPNSITQKFSYMDAGLFNVFYTDLSDHSQIDPDEIVATLWLNSADYLNDITSDTRRISKLTVPPPSWLNLGDTQLNLREGNSLIYYCPEN